MRQLGKGLLGLVGVRIPFIRGLGGGHFISALAIVGLGRLIIKDAFVGTF